MKQFVADYLLALQYFTRIPVTGPLADWAGLDPARQPASLVHLPGVGLLVGMAACVAFAIVSIGLPASPLTALAAAAACIVATVLLTGALHEDGLADLADGLGGSTDRDRALEIMKDPVIGSFGTLALVLAIGLKAALLAVIALQSPAAVLAALVAGHAVSRFWPLVIVHRMDNVGSAGASKSLALTTGLDRRGVWTGAAWCALPLLVLLAAAGFGSVLLALGLSAAGWWAMQRLLQRRLQGFTGDGLGATQQVCEIAFYLGAGFGLPAA